jgi:large subunit ribosomal protein L25
MNKINLDAQVRIITGRKTKNLRKEGLLPANVFGKKISSQALQLKLNDFKKAFEEAGETSLLTLKITGAKGKIEERPVLISNVQKNPVSDEVIHVDFHQVDLKEKVTASIPVELTGEAPAEKQGIGTVVHYLNEIEVEALPTDLPEKFVVDTSNLAEVDQAIYVKDLDYDKKKVEVKIDLETILVKVEPPQKEEVVEVPAEEVAPEGEAAAEGEAPAEGEAAAEGEQAKAEENKPEEEKGN